jgi:hypothetical protein
MENKTDFIYELLATTMGFVVFFQLPAGIVIGFSFFFRSPSAVTGTRHTLTRSTKRLPLHYLKPKRLYPTDFVGSERKKKEK